MRVPAVALVLSAAATVVAPRATALAQETISWPIHDESRPHPAVVDPGTGVPQATPGRPPSDAIVLFDGKDLGAWQARDGGPAAWKVESGYFEVVTGAGNIQTKQAFGDIQLHIELMEPLPAVGKSQERGNSGVFLMNTYEIQVLDSYENETYADGQAAALYGQCPPLVNACRRPGEWQAYDIVFEAPRFDADGQVTKRARVTVLHNGVVVQHAAEFTGPTGWKVRPPYQAHAPRLPLGLQDHGQPVRFRNVWVRELAPRV
jgi:hypothetical protein